MKILFKVFFFTTMLSLSNVICSAQTPPASKTQKFLEHYIVTMDTATTQKTWETMVNGVDRVTAKDPANWQNNYYSAFSHAMLSYKLTDKSKQEYHLNEAMKYIILADTAKPNESEIYTLKGMILAMMIGVNPEKGMELGPEATALFMQAKTLNPENPRVYLELGESAMYTPEQYGGGTKKAIEYLTTATAKYKAFVLPEPTWPHWGEKRAKMLLAKCKSLK